MNEATVVCTHHFRDSKWYFGPLGPLYHGYQLDTLLMDPFVNFFARKDKFFSNKAWRNDSTLELSLDTHY